MKKRRKEQLVVRKHIAKINKQLREDKFAGRFEVKQVGRIDKIYNNYVNFYPKTMTIDEVGDPEWHVNYYLIDVIDNEEPERNGHFQVRWSKTFGLVDVVPLDKNSDVYYRHSAGGLVSIYEILNTFIIESDFDEKWKSLEYAKTHWYSGKELKETLQWLGPNWESAEKLAKAEPQRFAK